MTATPLDLDALAALEKKATPGPWTPKAVGFAYEGHPNEILFYPEPSPGVLKNGDDPILEHDAALIAAMRNALPELLRRARRCDELEQENSMLRETQAVDYARRKEERTALLGRIDETEARVAELERQLAAVGRLEEWLALDSHRSMQLLLDIPEGHDRWELSAVAEGDGPTRVCWDKTLLGAIEAVVGRHP